MACVKWEGSVSNLVVIVELKDQADSIVVFQFVEALYIRPELTADMSALIISQNMFPNKLLFHSLYFVTLLPSVCLGLSPLFGAYCTESLM